MSDRASRQASGAASPQRQRSGSETRQRTKDVRIRLTPEEYDALVSASSKAALTLGSYARRVLLKAEPPRQARRPPVERAELAKLLGQVGRIGSNLNQLARHANAEGRMTIEAELEAEIAELRQVRALLLALLGRGK